MNREVKRQVEVMGIKSVNSLLCKTGRINKYRMAFLQGRGGSCKEGTWNRKSHRHDCCKSAVAWRHRCGCPRLEVLEDDPSPIPATPTIPTIKRTTSEEHFQKIYGRYPSQNELEQFRANYNRYDHSQVVRGTDIVHKRKRKNN